MAQANRIPEPTFFQNVVAVVRSRNTFLPHNFMPYYLATKELLERECVDENTLMSVSMDVYIDVATMEGFKIEVSHLKRTA